MKSVNNDSKWFNIYNNLETLNSLSAKRMDIRKELVLNNSFYKNEEKYDILLDNLVQTVIERNSGINITDTKKRINLSSKEYWNKLYNLKLIKYEKSRF